MDVGVQFAASAAAAAAAAVVELSRGDPVCAEASRGEEATEFVGVSPAVFVAAATAGAAAAAAAAAAVETMFSHSAGIVLLQTLGVCTAVG